VYVNIKGRVLSTGGVEMDQVTLFFSTDGETFGETVTDSSGNYSHNVPYGWYGTTLPEREYFAFNPWRRVYLDTESVIAPLTSQDFTAAVGVYISGQCLTSAQHAHSGPPTYMCRLGLDALVVFTGDVGETPTQGVNGHQPVGGIPGYAGAYRWIVPLGWSGDVIPTTAGIVYQPFRKTFTHVIQDQNGEQPADRGKTDFLGFPACYVSGFVVHQGVGLPGVTIHFSDDGLDAVTDESGYYVRPIAAGWSGTWTPSLPGYTFDPPSDSVSGATQGIDYSGQNFEAHAE